MTGKRIGLILLIALAPNIGWLAPGDGIGGSAHDFSGMGNQSTDKCTVCHTPPKEASDRPKWNHTLSTSTFSWTATETFAGTSYPTFEGDNYQGTTAQCLGCHDGSVAVGDIASWAGGSPRPLTDMSKAGHLTTFSGRMDGNHPVAMPIPWNNMPSTYNRVTTGRSIVLSEWQANPETLGIRLYHDDGSGNIVAGPVPGRAGIECTSCHEPHNGEGVEGSKFLRGTAAGICIKCHRK